MAELHLVCEGAGNGLDHRVLMAAIAVPARVPIRVDPAGGHPQVRTVRAWLQSPARGDVVFSVEDRNYRPPVDAEATWQEADGRSFMWRRHEIENYLLEPVVLSRALSSLRAAAALPQAEEEAEALLLRHARPMLERHAGLVLHAQLREVKKSSRLKIELNDPRPPAGPAGAAEWLAAMQEEIARMKRDCIAVSALADLQPDAVRSRFDTILGEVKSAAYETVPTIPRELAGKQMLSAIATELGRLSAGRITRRLLEEDLLIGFEQAYSEGRYPHDTDEFAELRARIENSR